MIEKEKVIEGNGERERRKEKLRDRKGKKDREISKCGQIER
jgi:hypothetical protein